MTTTWWWKRLDDENDLMMRTTWWWERLASKMIRETINFSTLNWADKEFFLIFLYIASLEQTWQNSSNINPKIELRALISPIRSNINSRVGFELLSETQFYDQANHHKTFIRTRHQWFAVSHESYLHRTCLRVQTTMHFAKSYKKHTRHSSFIRSFRICQMLRHRILILIYTRFIQTSSRISTSLFSMSNISDSTTQILRLHAVDFHFESFLSHHNYRLHTRIIEIRIEQLRHSHVHYLQVLKASYFNSRKCHLKRKTMSISVTRKTRTHELRFIKSNHLESRFKVLDRTMKSDFQSSWHQTFILHRLSFSDRWAVRKNESISENRFKISFFELNQKLIESSFDYTVIHE
jgi:hypothetical protein